jgi:small subunit ribosomal protein S1
MANETINEPVNETITDPRLEEGVWTTGPDGELIPDYESTFPTINEGEVVHGTVVRVDKDEVLVDIGYKSEGVIPSVSFPSAGRSIRQTRFPGDEIAALVMTKEDADGRLIPSRRSARFEIAERSSRRTSRASLSRARHRGRQGRLILDLGVRGFLPASLVDIRRVRISRVPRQGFPR